MIFCRRATLDVEHEVRVVQSPRPSRYHDRHKVKPISHLDLFSAVLNSERSSFACANFISTACTLGTDFVPTPETTIGMNNYNMRLGQ